MDVQRYAPYKGLALAVVITAILQAVLIARNSTITADGIIFISIARDLPKISVDAFHKYDQHPGFPAMILASTRLVQSLGFEGDPQAWIAGALAVNYVCGILCVIVVWCHARELFDAHVANIAALIFAFLPVPRANASDALSDTPHLLLYLLAAWLASRAVVQGGLLVFAAVGAISGLAYWIRPEGLEVAVIALVCAVVQGWRMHWPWKRLGAACLTLSGSAMLIVAPYLLLAGKLTSKQVPFAKVQAGTTFIAQQAEKQLADKAIVAPQATPAPSPATPIANVPNKVTASPPIATNPAATPPVAAVPATPPRPATESPKARYSMALILRLGAKAGSAFINSVCHGFKYVFIPFYLIGYIELIRRRPDWMRVGYIALLGLTHIGALFAVYFLSGYIAHRHVLPLVGLAMPFTALGVIYVVDRIAAGLKTHSPYPFWAVFGLSLAAVLPFTLRPLTRECVPLMEAMQWVQSQAEPGSGIVCNSPYVAFYSTMPVTSLGPGARTIDGALYNAPVQARYDFVVLHVGAHEYRPEWIAQLENRYSQVRLFPDPASGTRRPKKVLVFQSKEGMARREQGKTHS